MSKITNVNLSFCCKENWNAFGMIDDRTRFCATCKHKVIDFTKATSEELLKAKNDNGSVCGRFSRPQMSAAFLISLAASGTLNSCTEPGVTPAEHPVIPKEIEWTEEQFVTGMILFIEDENDTIPKDI